MAGGDAFSHPQVKPLDSHDVWAALVSDTPSPRTHLLYALDPRGIGGSAVTKGFGVPVSDDKDKPKKKKSPSGISGGIHAALRVGDWKIIDGQPGPGEHHGPDPSGFFDTLHIDNIASKWQGIGGRWSTTGYVIGPDVTDYAHPSIQRVSDSGQDQIQAGNLHLNDAKKLWLFNLAEDPYEENDLSASHPEKVAEMRAHVAEYEAGMVPGHPDPGPEEQKLAAAALVDLGVRDGVQTKAMSYWPDAQQPPFRRTSIASEAQAGPPPPPPEPAGGRSRL